MADQENPDVAKLKAFADEANIFQKQLLQESDRGAALVGAVYLDELLKRLFKTRMLDEKDLDKKDLRKKLLEYPGPLSTSASQTDVAYSLGWIGRETYHDLTVVRKIRNAFAHGLKKKPVTEKVTFSHVDIEKLCNDLKLPQTILPPGVTVLARDRFLLSVGALYMRLDYYRSESQEPVGASEPSFIRLGAAELGESV